MAPARSRPSGTPARQNRGPTVLPPYQPTTHPLNAQAQTSIRDLPRNHKLNTLKDRLKAANSHLTSAAADINDRFQERNTNCENARRRRQEKGSQSDGEEGAEMDSLRQKTDEITKSLDAKVRKVIDASAEVKGVEDALKELDANVTAGRDAISQTQTTVGGESQARTQRRRRIRVDDEDEFDSEENALEGDGAVTVLKRKIAEYREQYHSESLAARYAKHNDYIGFKRIVHDARHPGDDAPPLPHDSTWFPSTTSQNPNNPNETSPKDNEDDGLEVASERISIKCPITLLPMQDPVTSTKCVHSFEREAILSMINASESVVVVDVDGEVSNRSQRGTQTVRGMQCPVCEVMLTAANLQPNPILVRKIKRIQAALAAQNNPDSDSDDERGSGQPSKPKGSQRQEITSSPPARTTAARIKAERMSQARGGRDSRAVSMVPGTQIGADVEEEMDGDGEEEEEEEEE